MKNIESEGRHRNEIIYGDENRNGQMLNKQSPLFQTGENCQAIGNVFHECHSAQIIQVVI